jgi:hypothetical protein
MKVKDLLVMDIDIDVIDDICDQLEIAFVGPAKLTTEGLRVFGDVLEYEIVLNEDCGYCVIKCGNDPNVKWSHKLKMVTQFFYALAGYCSDKDWNTWFCD